MVVSALSFQLFDDLRVENKEDRALWSVVETWRIIDSIITVCDRPFIMTTSPLLQSILAHAHDARHEGTEKTLHRLRAGFHIPSMHSLVRDFVRACEVCHWNKGEQLRLTALLQPLDVPSAMWADVTMDFVEGFPRINGKSVILTVVDRLSKYAHFIPLGHPYSTTSLARAFFNNIALARHSKFYCE
jgi:hypothetical protein